MSSVIYGSLTPSDASVTPAKMSGAQSGSAPAYAVRAWVNFNGTGTVAIRGSGNVSSITDNGTGDYTVNFATAMSDANFAVCCSCSQTSSTVNSDRFASGWAVSTTQARVFVAAFIGTGTSSIDATTVSVLILR